MTGSLIQIISKGPQDVYLTGNPQLNLFKSVYMKHTNFCSECIVHKAKDKIIKSNKSVIVFDIDKYADLIYKIYVKTKTKILHTSLSLSNLRVKSLNTISYSNLITNLTNNDSIYFKDDYYYKNNDLYVKIIENHKFYKIINIDLNSIQISNNLTGANFPNVEFLYLLKDDSYFKVDDIDFYKVNNNYSKDITNIVNSVEIEISGVRIDKHYFEWFDIYNEFYESNQSYLNTLSTGYTNNLIKNTNYSISTNYIPLRFWFNNNIGLALPVSALQLTDIRLLVEFNPLIAQNIEIIDVNLLINHIFLDGNERKRFLRNDHEYLIEQLQISGPETTDNIDLIFNHPVKSIFWNIYGANYDSVSLKLNNHFVFNNSSDYFHLIQPYESDFVNNYSMNTSTRIWSYGKTRTDQNHNKSVYSFCLLPKLHQPSGSCNFSKIHSAIMKFENLSSSSYSIYVFAINYNVLKVINGTGGLVYAN